VIRFSIITFALVHAETQTRNTRTNTKAYKQFVYNPQIEGFSTISSAGVRARYLSFTGLVILFVFVLLNFITEHRAPETPINEGETLPVCAHNVLDEFPFTYRQESQFLACTPGECPLAFLIPKPSIGLRNCNLHGKNIGHIEADYVDIVSKAVMGSLLRHDQPKWELDGSSWPPHGLAITMVGKRRRDNLRHLLESIVADGIEGDFLEAGVWKGGLCVLATALFHAYEQTDRCVWIADSFRGIPKATHPVDIEHHSNAYKLDILTRNSVTEVQASFTKFGLQGANIRWLEGWFNETINDRVLGDTRFAAIRLDGDIYEYVKQPLEVLYPRLSKGGYVIIDDYTDWVGSKRAVQDFLLEHNLESTLIWPVYHEKGEKVRGVWWRKN